MKGEESGIPQRKSQPQDEFGSGLAADQDRFQGRFEEDGIVEEGC
jgi:hypothetical protein